MYALVKIKQLLRLHGCTLIHSIVTLNDTMILQVFIQIRVYNQTPLLYPTENIKLVKLKLKCNKKKKY